MLHQECIAISRITRGLPYMYCLCGLPDPVVIRNPRARLRGVSVKRLGMAEFTQDLGFHDSQSQAFAFETQDDGPSQSQVAPDTRRAFQCCTLVPSTIAHLVFVGIQFCGGR